MNSYKQQQMKTMMSIRTSNHNKSKDYENSVNRYASWAYQETFLVFLLKYFGFTVQLKKCKEGHTHRFARIQSIYYEIDNSTLQTMMNDQSEEKSSCSETSQQSIQIKDSIDQIDQRTTFMLFEDTEYFEELCSDQKTKTCGSKNINDFAKVSSLFMMYFFNTFGIKFDIKGEAKTFPIITAMKFGQATISNATIQEVGKKYFPTMVRGKQLSPEQIILDYQMSDKDGIYTELCTFLYQIQQAVYTSQKDNRVWKL